MQGKTLKLAVFLVAALALVVSVDIAPDAVDLLLARGQGENEVRIENRFFSCRGRSFALVRDGPPDDAENHDVVEAMGLIIYVPRSMSFENDIPRIATFPRTTGFRDVGVSNVIRNSR